VQSGDAQRVIEYLRAGVDVDSADGMARSALWHAAAQGDTAIVEILLQHKADVHFEDDVGETPLITALHGKHFGVAELILKAGADVNMVSGRQGQTPLHWTFNMDLKDEKSARVIWLIQHDADPARVNGSGRTVLEQAAMSERKWPFAGEILGHMEEEIKKRSPAVIRAQQMHAAKEEMCAAIHGGLKDEISVKPLRLIRSPKNL
jgi:hypothetical protein